VRLTVDGKSSTAAFAIKMDPRVKASALALQKKFAAETRLASLVTETSQALLQGGAMRNQLEKLSAQANSQTKDAIEALQKKLAALLGGPVSFFGPPSDQVTLGRVNSQASTLYQQVWQVDAEPTLTQMQALASVERDGKAVLARWNELKSTDLPAFNRVLHESNIPEVQLQTDAHQDESLLDEDEE
jgi:galactokinase